MRPSSFSWPDCPAYWSIDPSGIEGFSENEATELGFPSIQFALRIWLQSWESAVYNGLLRFHQAKGFDPYAPTVARRLGYPRFELADEMNTSVTYGNEMQAQFIVRRILTRP